jgi:outer membrane usher protein FimD/PapC
MTRIEEREYQRNINIDYDDDDDNKLMVNVNYRFSKGDLESGIKHNSGNEDQIHVGE